MSLDVAQRSNHESVLRRKDMSVEARNRAIVLRNFRAFDSGDLRTLEEMTAPGFVDHNSLEGQLPGTKGTMQASAVYRTAFPDAKIVVEDTIVEADRVVIRSAILGLQNAAVHAGAIASQPPRPNRIPAEYEISE
jgi:predicted ester cyclase